MKKSEVLISVIIANYNGKKYIKACIDSLLKEDSGKYEIIIIDDNSQDESSQYLKKLYANHKKIKLIFLTKSSGAAKARNIAATHASGSYLFFVDYDTQTHPGWGKAIPALFLRDRTVGAAQTKLYKMGTTQFDYAGDYLGPFGFLIERAQGAKDIGQFDSIDDIFSMKGAAMIVRKDIFKKVGGFDSDYEYLWEEPDLTWRIWLTGKKVVFLPTVIVEHAYVSETKNTDYYRKISVTYRGCRNNIMTLIKNYDSKNMLLRLPLHIACWLVLAFFFFLKLDFVRGKSIITGIFWNTMQLPQTLKKRQFIQMTRRVSEEEVMSHIEAHRKIQYYIFKATSYVTGKPY